ncbi:hippocampus abundant transcript-like protein 1 [Melia azedarach]|uniref:Hippocampus abundant transcript-like protein 1 n=1 Tax=Melia azedarach TaxID=155640 RepID=A0ACC1WT97_MELAZ|nr:hippocampus abundant transcript-like protein 1 [Melia azedarach]KAJ4702193.1 hippocampus abundant transcript-like protein 1 [Melia azedarach]
MEKTCGLSHLFMTIFLHHFSTFMVIPAITDITMSAVCPGRDECSLAIYLTGFQQAIIGLGTLVMMPLVGNLSDKYGRKAMLTVPITLTIIPLAILAYSRTRNFFYAYYVLKTLTAMVCEGSVHCLSLAYVADNVPEGRRASVFGILSGIGSCAFVCGNISTRFISTSSTFQVSASVAIVAAVYMRILLPESIRDENLYTPILSKEKVAVSSPDEESARKMQVFKRLPSIEDMVCLLKSSPTFSQAAIVAFFSNLADVGLHAAMMYYLKAKFHFNKDQFADLMVISGIAGTISQLVVMPLLAPALGEERMLSIGLLFNCAHVFLYSIAWSSWVPYAAAVFSILFVFAQPCMRTIVSKQVGSHEQGKAQGCISGICSFANVVSPLLFSPLTALFLSDRAPFDFPGFSIMCIGFASMMAFIQSIMIRAAPPISSQRPSNRNFVEA